MYIYNGITCKDIIELRKIVSKYAIPLAPTQYQLDKMGITQIDSKDQTEVTNGTIISD